MAKSSRSLRAQLTLIIVIGIGVFIPATAIRTDAQSSGPLAAYAFSESTGTVAADSSGNGNDAAVFGGATWTAAGRIGRALVGDGIDGGVQLPVTDSLSLSAAFTFEAWVSPSAVGPHKFIWASEHVNLMLTSGYVWSTAVLTGGTTAVGSHTPLPLNTWAHIAITCDGTTFRLYVNGALVDDEWASGNVPASTEPMTVGYRYDGPFSGGLDEVRLYGRALSANEIALDRTTPIDPSAPFEVALVTPSNGAVGVLTTSVTAAFTRAVDASTVTSSTFQLRDAANALVASSANYDASTRTVTLAPTSPLTPLGYYNVRVVSGGAGVADATGAVLASDATWTFRAAGADSQPAAAYAFSEGAGTAVTDLSGNGNDAALFGGPTWTTAGYVGNGIVGDGMDGGVRLPVTETLNLSTAFTFEAWVSPSAYGPHQFIWDAEPVRLMLLSGYVFATAGLTGGTAAVGTVTPLPLNTWTHVAITCDGTAFRLYINGVLVDDEWASGTVPPSTQPTTIGYRYDGPLAGTLDEVRIYRRALTGSEVAADSRAAIDVPAPTITSSCDFSVSPAAISTGSSGQSGLVSVTTGDSNCAWTAASDSPWVTVSGLGNGYAGQVLADSPVGYWRLDETSGTSVADSSGNGLTGSINSGATLQAAGALAGGDFAIALDGVDGRVRVPDAAPLDFSTGLTAEAWVKTTNSSGYQRLVGKGDEFSSWDLWLTDGGQLTAYLQGTMDYGWVQGERVLNDGQWHHVVLTWDGATVKLYADGALDSMALFDGSDLFVGPLAVTPATALRIGAGSTGDLTMGSLDEVAVYDHGLTPARVAAHYAQASAAPSATGSGFVAYQIQPNPLTSTRNANLTVAGHTVTITQTAAPTCTFDVSVANITAPWDGQSASITLTAPSGCAWSASSAPWTRVSPVSGVGSATLSYAIDVNPLAARQGVIVVGGQTIAIAQDAAPACVYTITPSSIDAPVAGTTGSVTTSTRWGCATSVSSNASWVSLNGAGSYSGAVLSDHPVAYWKFDEINGATAADSSGNAYDVNLSGNYTLGLAASGDGSTAIGFTQGFADLGYGLWSGSGSFSMEAWVRATGTVSGSILSQWNSLDYGFALDLVSSIPRFHAAADDETTAFSVDGLAAIGDGQWHHVVGVVDASNPNALAARLYVDGVLQGTSAVNADALVGGSDVVIGANNFGQSGFLTADVNDVAFYATALSASRIQQHVQAHGAPLPAPGADPLSTNVPYVVSANPTGGSRTATIAFGTASTTITEPGLPCNYSVSPTVAAIGASGGNVSAGVSSAMGCAWSASSDAPWITIGTVLDGYAGHVISDGPVGYWRLDELSGSVAFDSSGHGVDGTFEGDTTRGVSGVMAGDTTTAFTSDILIPNGAARLADPFSVEGWVNCDAGCHGTLARTSNWQLTLGTTVGFAGGVGETPLFSFHGQRSLPAGWHHIVATSDPGHNVLHIFIDGVLDGSGTFSTPPSGTGSSSLAFGPTTGLLDEIAMYPAALTAAQIAQHYYQQIVPHGGAGTVAYAIAVNTSTNARVGIVHAAGSDITITQAGHTCFIVTPTSLTIGTSGGSGTISVSAVDNSCGWTASSNEAWASLDAATGIGTQSVHYSIDVNATSLNRSATLVVAGQPITVAQSASPTSRPGLRYSLALGGAHVLALKNDGTVWSWGQNDSGQLGLGAAPGRSVPYLVGGASNIVAVAAGGSHSLALDSTGRIWAWGANNFGQLGDGTRTFYNVPTLIPSLSNVVALAAGDNHSVALTNDGTLWTWGRNVVGELGDGTQTTRLSPVAVATPFSVIAIAAQGDRTLALDVTGSVWAFGTGWGLTPMAMALPAGTIGSIGISGSDAFAVSVDGAVWAVGDNSRGQLGDGTTTATALFTPVLLPPMSAAVQVEGGTSHTIALHSDGTVWAWGLNTIGQLGNGITPCGPTDFTCVNTQFSTTPVLAAGPAGVIAIAAHGDTSAALTADGRVWTWGDNSNVQLGDGTLLGSTSPEQIADAGFAWHTGAPFIDPSGIHTDVFPAFSGSATPGAVVHYTLDGAEPTESDPIFPGAPTGISITRTTTLTVRAWAPGHAPSRVVAATYTLIVPPVTFSPLPGTYTSPQTVSMATSLSGATIRYTIDGSMPIDTSPLYVSPIAVGTGMILRAEAFNDGWVPAVANATYVMNFGVLAGPAISPIAGTYLYGEPISMAADPGAAIYYTTDGSTPTSASPRYTGAITLTRPTTISARAINPDWTDSPVTTRTYAAKVSAPAFTPDGGSYAPGQTIAMTDSVHGAVIHFTNNGLDPTINDPIAPGALPVGNFTLKARAFLQDLIASDVKTAAFARTGDPCTYAATPNVISAGPHASGGAVRVSAGDSSCSWTVTSDSAWLTVDTPSGSGASGQFAYHLTANATATVRSALLTIGEQDLLVVQAGQAACTYTVTPGSIAADANTFSGAVTVTAGDASCAWSAASSVPWATLGLANATGAYARAVLDDQPIGYWRFNEAAGATSAVDASSGAHAGAYVGGVTLGQSSPLTDGTTAIVFDGASGLVRIPHDSSFDATQTWEAWVNVPASSSGWRKILGKGNGVDEMFSLQIAPNATQPTIIWTTAGVGRETATLHSTIVGAGWTHIAFTDDGTTWHAYVNGQEDSSGIAAALAPNGSAIVFGSDELLASRYDGQLDEVAIYAYALGADQIANHVAQRTQTASGDGQVAFTLAANATGISRAGTLTIAGGAVPVSQAAASGLVISGSASPAPNSAGWNTTAVIVSFTCAGAGTITCPPPVSVMQDGVQDVLGQASNDSGGTATTAVHVQIDSTAPLLAISAPSRGQLVTAGPVMITGTAADVLSGVTGVTCNGAPAMLTDLTFTCTQTVPDGTTTIAVQATDAASNLRTTTLSVSTEDVVSAHPPTSLQVSPASATILTGETRAFSAIDDLGRVPSGAQWAVAPASMASVTSGPDASITGLSAGQVTVTASWQSLTATAHLTILPGVFGVDAPPAGIVSWSTRPAGNGETVKQIVQGAPTFDGPGLLYSVESTSVPGSSDVIRATRADGRETWAVDAGGRVEQLSADPGGAMVALVHNEGYPTKLIMVNARGDATNGPEGIKGFAIHPDGPLYYVDSTADISRLTSLDIGYGSGFTTSLPGPGGVPTVLGDGTVLVPSVGSGLSLTFLNADGSTRTQTIPGNASAAYKAVPNGQGGFLLQVKNYSPDGMTGYGPVAVVGVDASGAVSGFVPLGSDWGELVVGENGTVLATSQVAYWDQPNYGGGMKLHVGMLAPLTAAGEFAATPTFYGPAGPCGYVYNSVVGMEGWYYNGDCDQPVTSVTNVAALGGGGFVTSLSDGHVFGAGEVLDQTAFTYLEPVSDTQYLASPVTGGLELVSGPRTALPNSPWPGGAGSPQQSNAAATPGRGIFLKGQNVLNPNYPLPWKHAAIWIAPRHQSKWNVDYPARFYHKDSFGNFVRNVDNYGNYFMTIGAGPSAPAIGDSDTSLGCSGKLRSDVNRQTDVEKPILAFEPTRYDTMVEDQLIQRLLDLDANYDDTKLDYACFPDAAHNTYNSNSYAAGLLKASGAITPPLFPTHVYNSPLCATINQQLSCDEYPGFRIPVPIQEFIH